MANDHEASPLPPEAGRPRETMSVPPQGQAAAAGDQEGSPLPPDPDGREDIMSAEPAAGD
ncbi:MAG: hypothetical protein ACRDPY_35160 [Streptosporangiaceae bacterium]